MNKLDKPSTPALLQGLFSLRSSQRCNLAPAYDLCTESTGNGQARPLLKSKQVEWNSQREKREEGSEWRGEVCRSGGNLKGYTYNKVRCLQGALGPTRAWLGRCGVVSLFNDLRQTNGKKKLKGSLALMVGRALKPASAGADTSTKVTAVEIRIVLLFPELVCNKKKSEWCKPCPPVYSPG